MQEGTGRPPEGKPTWVFKLDHGHSKESACNVGDLSLIPGMGRSPGEGNGDPLQYLCLENSMDREAWWATVYGISKESDTTEWLNNNSFVETAPQ